MINVLEIYKHLPCKVGDICYVNNRIYSKFPRPAKCKVTEIVIREKMVLAEIEYEDKMTLLVDIEDFNKGIFLDKTAADIELVERKNKEKENRLKRNIDKELKERFTKEENCCVKQ